MAYTVATGIIRTARLDLVQLALPIAAAILTGDRPPGVRWALGYPTEGTLISSGLVVTADNSGHPLGAFGPYQVIHRDSDMVVGDCGFEGPPGSDGDVRVGFGTCPSQRRRGYAREALQGLIRWAHTQEGVERVIADTARTNHASIRVMENAGMRRYRTDESLVYYEA